MDEARSAHGGVEIRIQKLECVVVSDCIFAGVV